MAYFIAKVYSKSQPDDHSRFFVPDRTPYPPVEQLTIEAQTEDVAKIKLEKMRPLYKNE